MANSSVSDTQISSYINVLIVDDQSSMRSIIRQLLASEGITQVWDVANGRQAMEFMQRYDVANPDVIICDLYMDEMDGMEFVHQLRRRKDTTPVLLLTGEKSEFIHEVAAQAGASKVLTKPISAPDLAKEIHWAIGTM